MVLDVSNETQTTEILTASQREEFDRDGYLVIESPCDDETIEGILADMQGRYRDLEQGERVVEEGVMYTPNRIMDAWKISDHVKTLARSPKVLGILEQLYGRKPLPFQTLNFPVGTEQAVHSDTVHFNSMPAGYMAGVWVALEDMDMDNGPLVYYPGSHKLPEVTMQDAGVEADPSEYPHYERFIANLIEREGLEPQYATIRKGQGFIWAANLLHGGSPQRDKTRTRHSQVTHYHFEGCKYYMPLSSKEGAIAWRNPEWIT
jgi:ectoine hydroxylase-related dioxygenase (phytanoyl-CoA dioxygenase family)